MEVFRSAKFACLLACLCVGDQLGLMLSGVVFVVVDDDDEMGGGNNNS